VARLRNARTGSIVAGNVEKARSVWRRLSGFLPYRTIPPDRGLWFDNCSAIHTLGMRSRIDAVFLSKDHRVMKVRYSVPRHRLAVGCAGAHVVIELGEAAPAKRDIFIGDRLALE
jgi:uncharacterized membrane protein (UPF0127 family)